MHGNVCVVTQTGNENWSLDLWHEALDDCSREFISRNIMVEFVGHHLDCDTGAEDELAPVYFALILSNGLSSHEVVELVKKRMWQHLPESACFVRWMDQRQRDSEYIIRQFYVYDDNLKWFDRKTGTPLTQTEAYVITDEGDEDTLHCVDQSNATDWGQFLFDDDYYGQIYRTMEMYFPLLGTREENFICHPRDLFTTGFIPKNAESELNHSDGAWIEGRFHELVFCNNFSVWGLPETGVGFEDLETSDLEFDVIERVFNGHGQLKKYLPI